MGDDNNFVRFPKNTSLLSSGSSLHWRNLTVKVPLDRRSARTQSSTLSDVEQGNVTTPSSTNASLQSTPLPTTKTILDNTSGYVEPGQILFIMGPSGSGKSTMLDALADRVKHNVTGTQLLDGRPKTTRALKSVAKYVQQTDDLLGVLTVKETLDSYAGLYVSDASARSAAVVDVLDILGLTAHAHTKIGNAFVRGLSGGQVRRVSIGAELVAAPNLLFLDEPTSGLDSATASHVMSELKRIAHSTAMAMIVTVHQPSQLIFEMADSLLLISGGKTCYFGATENAAEYFRALGFVQPARTSEVEWMLDLINRDFGQHETVDRCIEMWPTSNAASTLNEALDQVGLPDLSTTTKNKSKIKTQNIGSENVSNITTNSPTTTATTNHINDNNDNTNNKSTETKTNSSTSIYNVNFLQQTKVLTIRGVLNTIRNPAVLWLRFAMYLMLSLMIGLVWLRLGRSSKYIIDTNNALFYVCAFMIFMSVSVLPAYLEERSVLMRERANGAYSIWAYITSHTIYELPYVFILALSASLVTYFMVGLTPGANRFFIFVANLFTSLLVAESMMVFIAAVIPILIIGIAAGAMTFGLFMCVQGAFISVDRIGWWLRWVRYVALHYYSFSTFLVNQHRDQIYPASPENEFPPYPNDVIGETIYKEMGLEERMWVNFVAQIAMIIFYRAMAALWLHFFVKGKK